MRIDFTKELEGKNIPSDCLSERELGYSSNLKAYILGFKYDLEAISSKMCAELASHLDSPEQTSSTLFVPKSKLLVKINSFVKHAKWYDRDFALRESYVEWGSEVLDLVEFEKAGQVLAGLSGRILGWHTQVVREVPEVIVRGALKYEDPKPEIVSMIDILKKLGYSSRVVATAEELEEVVRKPQGKLRKSPETEIAGNQDFGIVGVGGGYG